LKNKSNSTTTENSESETLEETIEKAYKEYSKDFHFKQYTQFFESHKEESWMEEKYSPAQVESYKQRIHELKRKLFQTATEELSSGKWDLISFVESKLYIRQLRSYLS
jgi:type III secretory pathway component EscR